MPVVAIAKDCITLTLLPVVPPETIADVELAKAVAPYIELVRSPKSVPFPALAIVIYSITLTAADKSRETSNVPFRY